MKKVLLICLLFLSFMLTGCGKLGYKEISYDDLMKKMENKESFPLFIGAESCSHCATYKKALKKFINNYDVTIYYLDIDNISKDEYSSLIVDLNFTRRTPTTMIITDGEKPSTSDMFEGADYDKLVKMLTDYGYIGE